MDKLHNISQNSGLLVHPLPYQTSVHAITSIPGTFTDTAKHRFPKSRLDTSSSAGSIREYHAPRKLASSSHGQIPVCLSTEERRRASETISFLKPKQTPELKTTNLYNEPYVHGRSRHDSRKRKES